MRLRLRSFLLTSALTFAPALASATTISGIYVDGGSGYNEVQDQHVHANSPANGDALPKFSVNHGTGFAGFGAVGYGFGNGLRVEAEGLYNFSHDNYTSSYTDHYTETYTETYTEHHTKVETTNTTLQNYYKEMGKPFYTMVPGAKQVSCTSGSDPLYSQQNSSVYPANSETVWGTGNPDIRGTTTTEPTGNDPWTQWTPADKCYVISNPTDWNTFSQWSHNYVSATEPLFGYPAGEWYPSDWGNKDDTPAAPAGWHPQGWTGNMGINPYPGTYGPTTGNEITSSATDTGIGSVNVPSNDVSNSNSNNNNLCNANKFSSIPYSYTHTVHYTTEHTVEHTIHRTMNLPMNHNGSDESWGGFANVLYDFDLERLFGLKSIATPFIGGGAGYLWQRYNRPNTMIAAITGTHGGFSWQGIAGVAFDTGIAGLQVVAQYRMIGQPGSFYNGAFNYGTEGGHANFDQRFNHQFIVGFRYAFQNQPIHHSQPPAVRPIVAAAPAPVPARSYLVFFDWNQYTLTSRARQIVVEAAHATSYVHTTRINVNGYTDSSAAPGPAGQRYNYALSVKRARSVEAELIRNGVPASEIVIRGYGDTNPLVPTGPNTREPQNRRVEIILHA